MNGGATIRRAARFEGQRAGGCTRKPRGLLLLAALLAFSVWPAVPSARAQAAAPTEYQLKAAFLFNFAKFTDWPNEGFGSAQSPFLVCILGKDPFGRALDDMLQGKTIAEHPIVIERLRDAAGARRCQVVFVSKSESSRLAAIFQALRGSIALLVGETDGFARLGGAIELTLEEDRVGFIINPDAVGRARLRLSSKLLALARIVHDDSSNGKS